jgi:hypothetical protein
VQSYDVTPFLKFKGMQECCAFFGHCDQNTWENNLKGGIIHFCLQFQSCQSIMVERTWQSRAAHIITVRKYNGAVTGRDQGRTYSLGRTSSNLLSPPGSHPPQVHYLPIGCSIFESINGLNHSLCQSPHDPIIRKCLTDPPRDMLTNLPGMSQSNQIDNQNWPSQLATR